MGIKKTLEKVRNSDYFWPWMRQVVTDYVLACDVCEERKKSATEKRAHMKTFLSGETFQRIALDLAGSFPKSENLWIFLNSSSDELFYKICPDIPLMNI